MGVVNYLTVEGEILSETRNGVDSDYIPDPLVSTAKLVTTGGVITDTFLWWPYGELRSHVGSSVTPFGYGGTLGYYSDLATGLAYVRARWINPALTQWQTLDRLWPSMQAYAYTQSSPVSIADPSGMFCHTTDFRFGIHLRSHFHDHVCYYFSKCWLPCESEDGYVYVSRFDMPSVPSGGVANIAACIKWCCKGKPMPACIACTVLCSSVAVGTTYLLHGCMDTSGASCVQWHSNGCFSVEYSCCSGGGFGK
jgi:RHS repeat-associated protein